MQINDHNPPHIHASYQGFNAVFLIHTHKMIKGRMPKKAISLVQEWMQIYHSELLENWDKAKKSQSITPIPPLE